MTRKGSPDDPKGLIFEAYRMDGITKSECRTIFLDWALSIDAERDTRSRLRTLLEQFGQDEAHPMTQVLQEGLHTVPTPRRRGGWRSRPRD